ncbi:MAG: hypothetical protein AAF478_03535 [Pseudomonadota bacterium]
MPKQDHERVEGRFSIYQFQPPGPVAARFIESMGPIDMIRGPWGSGKTVACVFKAVRHAARDAPICRESNPKYPYGVVRVRIAAIRDTYREMAKTALASWHEFFPKNGPFTRGVKDAYTGGSDRPVLHKLEWETIRKVPGVRGEWIDAKVPILLDMEFGAIGTNNLDSFFKGYEITFGWVNECDLCEKSVPSRLYGRTGRYPPQTEIQPWEAERLGTSKDPDTGIETINVPRIIMGDFNPPDESNYTYTAEIEEPEEYTSFNFFAQPSGLSPQAENRIGKSRQKYEEEERAFGGPTSPDSLRNVHGQYAAKTDQGTPVYSGLFDTQKHRSIDNLEPIPNLPLYLGIDGGGSPACGIAQILPTGQARLLREIVTFPITGPSRFSRMIKEVLLQEFPGFPIRGAWADPSSFDGGDSAGGDLAFIQTVMQALQIIILPTEASNRTHSRIEAVKLQLQDIDANTPGLICDPRMKYTIRGFVSQYRLTKRASEAATDNLVIDKNEFSHIHDAWQYLFLGYRGGSLVKQSVDSVVGGANIVPITSTRSKPPTKSIWDV